MAELLCPKCRMPMESLERSGVTIERCTECGGLFLDRGELERLEVAEQDGPARNETSSGSASQNLLTDLLSLAKQYRGGKRRY